MNQKIYACAKCNIKGYDKSVWNKCNPENHLDKQKKSKIRRAVKKALEQYMEVFRRLKDE